MPGESLTSPGVPAELSFREIKDSCIWQRRENTNKPKETGYGQGDCISRDEQQGWDSAGFTTWHSKANQALLESDRGMARATSDNAWLPNSCFSHPWGRWSRLHLPSSPTARPSLEIQGLD